MPTDRGGTGRWDCASTHGYRRPLLVIGMAGAQAGADALRDFQKLWRFSDFERAVARKIAVDDVDDPARPRRHDYNLAGEKYRFRNRMGDEDNRLPGLVPKPQKLFVEMVTHDFVE